MSATSRPLFLLGEFSVYTRGSTFRLRLGRLWPNGKAELKFLSPSIIPHLSFSKFGIIGLDRLNIG